MVYFGVFFAGVFGAIIGSFSVAQVWRLRAAELYDIKKSGGEVDKKEWSKLKYLISEKHKKNRSHCLSCGYKLQWFDLIPVFSWLSLGGKCRKCHTKIGLLEFLAEVATAIIFGIIFASMQVDLIKISAIDLFRITLLFLALSPLVILFVYDAKWSLLPVKVKWIFNFLAGILKSKDYTPILSLENIEHLTLRPTKELKNLYNEIIKLPKLKYGLLVNKPELYKI